MKGFISILILALWLNQSDAMPDLLAPFRTMFGIKSNSASQSGGKPSSSSKGGQRGYVGNGPHPGGPPGPEDDDPSPFNSNFGFGRPPPGSSASDAQEGPSSFGSYPPPRGSSLSPFSRPQSSSSASRPSRPVRNPQGGPGPFGLGGIGGGGQRPGSSHRPSYYSQGPPSSGSQSGPESGPEDLSAYRPGPPPPNFQRGNYQSQGESGPPSYSQGGPSYQSGPPSFPSFSQGGPGGPGGPYQGGPGGPQDGPQSEGPGYSGFGSYPQNAPEDDRSQGQGHFGGGGGGGPSYRPRARPFRSSRPVTPLSSPPIPGFETSSARPSRYNSPGGPGGPGGPQFFGGPGPSDYPPQYNGGSGGRGPREPQVIEANDVNKYPPQINDDEPEGPYNGPSGPGGPDGPGGPPGFGPPNGGGRGSSGFGFGGPPGGSNSPAFPPSPFGNGGGDDQEDGPGFHNSGARYPSGSGKSFAYSRPVSAGYQASSEGNNGIHYGKPMMMAASGNIEAKVKSPVSRPRKISAKIPQKHNIVRLVSPKDPNYRSMSSSSVNPVIVDSDLAATEHGHHHGGDEHSSNGDRILYHVSGHQGPYSYRFGYDTGKGSYNRLFRFEEKDGKGYVKGKYGFHDKHGKLNVINYEAHPKHGFHAERAHSHGLY